MLGRVLVVVLAILSSLPVFPQCSYSPVRSAEFRSSALDLAIEGNDLWVATSYGISLYDRSVDPPKLVASVVVPGITRAVRAQGGAAYAGSGSSLVVIQKSGPHALMIEKTLDAGASINDMVVTTLDIYVASNNGIAQYDRLNGTAKTPSTFATSRPAVTSLAQIGSALYAADGDASIEAFDISIRGIPRLMGSVTAPVAINFVRATNAKLYASSGLLNTYVFSGTGASMTNAGSGPFGMSSLAPLSGDVAFMAGGDRRLRVVDFSVTGSPVEIFRADLPPTNGTINRISAIATAGSRVYVAAGDIGVVSYDIDGFASPFAIRAYSTGGGTSVFFLSTSVADRVYIGRDSGGITEFTQSSSGSLTQARSWDGSRSDTIWDGNNGFLLSSSGVSMTMWTVLSATPQTVASTTFRAPVASAILAGTTGYAVLTDGSLWSADFAQAAPVPKSITAVSTATTAIARSGSAIVLAGLNAGASSTDLYYFASGDLAQTPKTANVPGLATTRVALSGSTAAMQTFQGITLVDFTSGTSRVLPSSTTVARCIQLNGSALYVLTDTSLIVWDTQAQAITRQFTIPADAVTMHAPSSIVDVVTTTGITTIATTTSSKLPLSIATPNSNAYYRRVATGAGRIDLFDGSKADIYLDTLRYVSSLRGITDVAANDDGVYAISNALVASSYTADGGLRGSQAINSTGARAVGIRTAGDAVWVSVESGCPTCVQTTYVFDPRNGMLQTTTFNGGVVDVATNGTRAYVLTDFPSEIRVMNISDPFHPSPIITAPAPQSPVSIAYSNGTIYVLGDKLFAFTESTLTRIGDILGSYTADPTGVITAADQRVRIDGNCAIVVGRAFSPQLYTIGGATAWTAAPSFSMPSATRSIATRPGVIQLLTDHSLETWATKPIAKPPRREPAR